MVEAMVVTEDIPINDEEGGQNGLAEVVLPVSGFCLEDIQFGFSPETVKDNEAKELLLRAKNFLEIVLGTELTYKHIINGENNVGWNIHVLSDPEIVGSVQGGIQDCADNVLSMAEYKEGVDLDSLNTERVLISFYAGCSAGSFVKCENDGGVYYSWKLDDDLKTVEAKIVKGLKAFGEKGIQISSGCGETGTIPGPLGRCPFSICVQSKALFDEITSHYDIRPSVRKDIVEPLVLPNSLRAAAAEINNDFPGENVISFICERNGGYVFRIDDEYRRVNRNVNKVLIDRLNELSGVEASLMSSGDIIVKSEDVSVMEWVDMVRRLVRNIKKKIFTGVDG